MCDVLEDRQWSLPSEVRSPGAARNLVRTTVAHSHTDPEQVDLAVLLTSELVSNTVRHTSSDRLTLEVHCDGHSVTVAVSDTDGSPLPSATPEPTSEGGRGLLMIRNLASAWGSNHGPDGKRVWFTTTPHR